MKKVKDFLWMPNMKVETLVDDYGSLGYQAIELNKASDVVMKMKQAGAKVYLTFTSNMVTSGLRGFFAQLFPDYQFLLFCFVCFVLSIQKSLPGSS